MRMIILRVPPTFTDRVLETLKEKGEMTVEEAAETLGCSRAGVIDFLQKLVGSTIDPQRYIIRETETSTLPGRVPLRTVQVLVESRRQTALRRRMMRLPEFPQVARLPPPPGVFTLGQAARALGIPSRKAARLLERYKRMGYLASLRVFSSRGATRDLWQRIW